MDTRTTIFYVDDDVDDLDFFKEAIDAIGRDVSLFVLGDEMIHALNNPPPNPSIVFLDLNMPGKNGFDVLKELKELDAYKDLPIVILSTANDQQNIDMAKKAGANLYIKKANSVQDLKKSIQFVLDIDWSIFDSEKCFVYKSS